MKPRSIRGFSVFLESTGKGLFNTAKLVIKPMKFDLLVNDEQW